MQLEHWLFAIGYSLAFGAVLAKMWRVFHIFHNPKPKKKVRKSFTIYCYNSGDPFKYVNTQCALQIMKDWLLIVISLTVCGIVVVLLFLETTVPHLRGAVVLERDSEDSVGRDVSTLNNE